MRREILPFVMTMLLNPYPRVRRYTAEQLYVKFAEDGLHVFCGQDLRVQAVFCHFAYESAHLVESENAVVI